MMHTRQVEEKRHAWWHKRTVTVLQSTRPERKGEWRVAP